MARSFKDIEFWLPPQFLNDDDILMEKKKSTAVNGCNNMGFGSFCFASDLSSPVESLLGSTETESDEEDYLAVLTRQMAHSTLEDCFRNYSSENTKAWVMAGSPQSTLCPLGSGCGCRKGSSLGSPTGPLQGKCSSPATWDLLYAAAGQVARMRMNEELFGFNPNRGLLGGPPRKPSNPTHDLGFHSNQSISYKQFQAAQFQQMKQQQMMKRQSQAMLGEQLKAAHQMAVQNRARNAEILGNRSSRQMGLSASGWPPPQQQQQPQQNGSGTRTVFHGTAGSKRVCAGTGVFLPRRAGYPHEPRKNPPPPPPPQVESRFNGGFNADSDVALRIGINNVLLQAQQKRNILSQQPVMNHEIRLPQEWTY